MSNVTQSPATIMQTIQQTPALSIPDLEFVKNKFIENYNLANRSNQGDLVYHRQVVFFKQLVSASSQLASAAPFSLYACFLTAAVKGYSLDPNDGEVYLIPTDGKARLQRQAGAHVRRLITTGQIVSADQPKLVYHGDDFEVMNGRVLKHIERFSSDTIIAGYLRVILNDKGDDKYFIYRKSDWESWRKKSPNPKTIEKDGQFGKYLSPSPWDSGTLNGTQPEPGFLKTKIVSHATQEKCWASGSLPVQLEQFEDIEVDIEETPAAGSQLPPTVPEIPPAHGTIPPAENNTPTAIPPATPPADDDFLNSSNNNQEETQGKVLSDDDF